MTITIPYDLANWLRAEAATQETTPQELFVAILRKSLADVDTSGSILDYMGFMDHEGYVLRVKPGYKMEVYLDGEWHHFGSPAKAATFGRRISATEAAEMMRKDGMKL